MGCKFCWACLAGWALAVLGQGCGAPSGLPAVAVEQHRSTLLTKPLSLELAASLGASRLPLQVELGAAIAYTQAAALRSSARTVRVDVRDSDGSKTALVTQPMRPSQRVSYQTRLSGFVSVHRCTRPAALDERSDAWQIASSCEIFHVRVRGDQPPSWDADRHLTTKIGLPVELRPYVSTAFLQPGDHLPLRLYQKGRPVPGHTLTVIPPESEPFDVGTNARGVAEIEISRAGSWEVRAQLPEPALASNLAQVRLHFDVEPRLSEKKGV